MSLRIFFGAMLIVLSACSSNTNNAEPTSQVSTYELTGDEIVRLQAAARTGNAVASERLYDYYALSKLDTAKSFEWLQLAADQGVPRAQYNLSALLRTYPPKRDYSKADEWLRKAADNGYGPAIEALKRAH